MHLALRQNSRIGVFFKEKPPGLSKVCCSWGRLKYLYKGFLKQFLCNPWQNPINPRKNPRKTLEKPYKPHNPHKPHGFFPWFSPLPNAPPAPLRLPPPTTPQLGSAQLQRRGGDGERGERSAAGAVTCAGRGVEGIKDLECCAFFFFFLNCTFQVFCVFFGLSKLFCCFLGTFQVFCCCFLYFSGVLMVCFFVFVG